MSAVGWEMPVGTEFAGYRITGMIGRGGMSSVYSAEHLRLGRAVALKVLAPALAADEAFRDRFKRESQLAATLEHPSVIPIYDAGEAEGMLYIAMRLVRGEDLGMIIEGSGPLSLGQTLFVIEQVGGGLDHAHERGLIHRDVKPANILIERPSDHVYLTDFGVVKETSSRGMTRTGFFLGTFEYAAPEQIEGKEIDARTDIYALGCVLYECLTGEAPYAAQTEGSVIHAHLVEPPPKLTAMRPELPVGVNDVIATAMAKAKEDRYPSGGELTRALRAVAFGATSADRSVHAPTVQGVPAATVFSARDEPRVASPTAADSPGTAAAALPLAAADAGGAGSGGTTAQEPSASEQRPTRTVELTGRRIATVALVVVAIVAAAVAAAVLLTRGGSTKASGGTSTTEGTTTGTTTGGGTAVAVGLAGVVPATLMKYCTTGTAQNGASQTAVCTAPTSSAGTTFWPDSWSFSLYPSTAAALRAYDALRRQNGVGSNFGRCDRTSWAGEGAWLHNPEPGAQPKKGGRRFCYFQGNVAVIVWLHAKLGQPNHIDMVGIAKASGSDHFHLYSWYAFWHHTVGKCLAPGCVAKLE